MTSLHALKQDTRPNAISRLASLTGWIIEEARKLDREIANHEGARRARPYAKLDRGAGEEYSSLPGLIPQAGLSPKRLRRVEIEVRVKQALAILEPIRDSLQ